MEQILTNYLVDNELVSVELVQIDVINKAINDHKANLTNALDFENKSVEANMVLFQKYLTTTEGLIEVHDILADSIEDIGTVSLEAQEALKN